MEKTGPTTLNQQQTVKRCRDESLCPSLCGRRVPANIGSSVGLAKGPTLPHNHFVPHTLSQPPWTPVPGGTKLTSFLHKGIMSLPALGFPQVWERGTLWEDKSSKSISVKDGTSEGVWEQASAKGHWEEG